MHKLKMFPGYILVEDYKRNKMIKLNASFYKYNDSLFGFLIQDDDSTRYVVSMSRNDYQYMLAVLEWMTRQDNSAFYSFPRSASQPEIQIRFVRNDDRYQLELNLGQNILSECDHMNFLAVLRKLQLLETSSNNTQFFFEPYEDKDVEKDSRTLVEKERVS
jgi:hypothetical protein